MSVGTDNSKEVRLRVVNCNSDAAGNATMSRIGEVGGSSSKDEFHSGQADKMARAPTSADTQKQRNLGSSLEHHFAN